MIRRRSSLVALLVGPATAVLQLLVYMRKRYVRLLMCVYKACGCTSNSSMVTMNKSSTRHIHSVQVKGLRGWFVVGVQQGSEYLLQL